MLLAEIGKVQIPDHLGVGEIQNTQERGQSANCQAKHPTSSLSPKRETTTKACLLNQRFFSKLITALAGYARACAPLRYYIISKGTPPDESTVANSLIDQVFARPGTSTRSFTVLATLAPCPQQLEDSYLHCVKQAGVVETRTHAQSMPCLASVA